MLEHGAALPPEKACLQALRSGDRPRQAAQVARRSYHVILHHQDVPAQHRPTNR